MEVRTAPGRRHQEGCPCCKPIANMSLNELPWASPPFRSPRRKPPSLTTLLANPPAGEEKALVELLIHRVPAGVDDAARVKADFLASVAKGTRRSPWCRGRRPRSCWAPCWAASTSSPSSTCWTMPGWAPSPPRASRRPCWSSTDFADVKAKADAGNAQRQGRAEVLGRGGVVHQPPRGAPEPHRDRLQGHGRDQHRRPVAGPGRLEPPRHPAPRPGHAQERPPRHHPR